MTGAAQSNPPALQSAELSRVSLNFKDDALERLFEQEFVSQALPITRIYLILGLLAYLLFGFLDWYLLGNQAGIILAIRAIASSIIILCIAACYVPRARRYIQLLLCLAVCSGACGVLAMLAILKPPYSYMYYVGSIVVIIYGANLVILRYYLSACISFGGIAIYMAISLWINPLPDWVLIANLSFLFSAASMTAWTSYWQETYTRRDFAHRQLLRIEKLRTEELLDAARAGNRAKSEFLAVMSHELRTPLNAIIGFSEVMQKQLFGPVGSTKYMSYIDDIADSGHHLLRVINDILDLSKAEAGKLEIHEDEIDVVDFVQHSLRMFREKASVGGLTLAFTAPEPGPVLWADSRLTRQLLINLISNAVKFTLPGGKVTVEVQASPTQGCRIAVIDTGIGLQPQDIPRVLQPFVQVESALSRKQGGTGLGLPLVKRIVERHGGEFILTSELGKGTTAAAIFPPERLMGATAAPSSIRVTA